MVDSKYHCRMTVIGLREKLLLVRLQLSGDPWPQLSKFQLDLGNFSCSQHTEILVLFHCP